MRDIPLPLQQSLVTGVTTLCWCWRLTRRDGRVQGFTEHDRDLTFDGTTFESAAGMTASDMRESVGLSVDNLEVESALSSARLDDADIEAGLYDDARVEIFRVDWQEPETRVLMRAGTLGEVKRSGRMFVAEVRGISHYLQQTRGRLFQHACDAALGDARCGVDLSTDGWRWTTAIAMIREAARVVCAGVNSADTGLFARGVFEVTGGTHAGFRSEIKRHEVVDGSVVLTLWQPLPAGVAAGDAARVTVGCDKHIATCRDRFANAVNFRGFPHMPGNDFLTSVARPGEPVVSGGNA